MNKNCETTFWIKDTMNKISSLMNSKLFIVLVGSFSLYALTFCRWVLTHVDVIIPKPKILFMNDYRSKYTDGHCQLAEECKHDGNPVYGTLPDNRTARRFLDVCDLHEYNCDHNANFKPCVYDDCRNQHEDENLVVDPDNSECLENTHTDSSTQKTEEDTPCDENTIDHVLG